MCVGLLLLAACEAPDGPDDAEAPGVGPAGDEEAGGEDPAPAIPDDPAAAEPPPADDPAPDAPDPDDDPPELHGTRSCGKLPRSAHRDRDEVDEAHGIAADCLVWFGLLDDAGYTDLEPAATIDDDELTALFAAVGDLLDAPDRAEAARAELSAPLARGDAMVAAAQALVRLSGDGAALSDDESGPDHRGSDGYRFRVRDLPDALEDDARASTWEEGCPVHLDDLRVAEVVIVDMAGTDRWGQLVIHADVAEDVGVAFGELHTMRFAIDRMEPIERFGGDDDASMAANNTSAFNCRPVTGSDRWSEHSYGWAIDLNPIQNPYVRGRTVLPEAGSDYLDRTDVRPGMLVRPGPVEAFDAIGWGWGGDWESLKDYQHVSRTGR